MRPEDILAQPARVLARSDRETYFRDGFVALEGAMTLDRHPRLWEFAGEASHA